MPFVGSGLPFILPHLEDEQPDIAQTRTSGVALAHHIGIDCFPVQTISVSLLSGGGTTASVRSRCHCHCEMGI